jgi:chemotaxis protein MotB
MEHKPRPRRRFFDERHENRERWIISYADFITLLFATFVVLYAMSSLNVSKYRMLSESMENAFLGEMLGHQVGHGGAQKGALDHMPAPVPVPSHLSPEIQRQLEQRERNMLQSQLAGLIRSGAVTVLRQPNGIAIDIPATLLFPSGSATLMPEALQTIDSIGHTLADAPYIVQVNGYTDNVPMHSAQFDSNWELSAMRAISVVRRFTSTGIAPERLVGAGYGEFHPVVANDSDEHMARNRRVSIIVIAPNPETNPDAAAADAPADDERTQPLAPDSATPENSGANTAPDGAPATLDAAASAPSTPMRAQSSAPEQPASMPVATAAPVPLTAVPVPLTAAPMSSNAPAAPAPQPKPAPAKPTKAAAPAKTAAVTQPIARPSTQVFKALKFDPRLFGSRHD